MSLPSTDDAVDQITASLQKLAQPSKKEWWEKYLKHVIEFYGVPMADIRTSVNDWVNSSGLLLEDGDDDKNDASSIVLKQTAWSLIEQPVAEQKLAGILIFQNHVDMSVDDLSVLEKLFQNKYIYDWNTTDWLCVRVLGPLVSREGDAAVAVFKKWAVQDTESATLWQRRAALVAFVNIASEHCDHVLEIAGVLAQDDQRFAQTAVGWVLRNLASTKGGHATKVVEFLKQNKGILSAEAINMASAKMSDDHRRQAGIVGKRKRR